MLNPSVYIIYLLYEYTASEHVLMSYEISKRIEPTYLYVALGVSRELVFVRKYCYLLHNLVPKITFFLSMNLILDVLFGEITYFLPYYCRDFLREKKIVGIVDRARVTRTFRFGASA